MIAIMFYVVSTARIMLDISIIEVSYIIEVSGHRSFEDEFWMTTTLSRQHEMTRAIGAKNDESRSRTRTHSQI